MEILYGEFTKKRNYNFITRYIIGSSENVKKGEKKKKIKKESEKFCPLGYFLSLSGV